MAQINIETKKQVYPQVYAYSTPQIADHDGWTKIGYTEKKDVNDRIKEQGRTIDTKTVLEWYGDAFFMDGSGDRFSDKMFQAYLRKCGFEQKKKTEWLHIDGPTGYQKFHEFRMDHGILMALDTIPYDLREEQSRAVRQTKEYWLNHPGGEFLWNAKPRFGKSLSAYDFCMNINARNVLIVTNRPAIANSWYSDYAQFLGENSGFKFVSDTDSLVGKPYVMSRREYTEYCVRTGGAMGCIEFVSLQDLKGSLYFGGEYDKLGEVRNLMWDVLIVDEAHEGVDTTKTETAFRHIQRKFTLHLSGTPFKALANDKFPAEAIFNWTYADEQKAKRDWVGDDNPYESLPRLNLFTYQMSEIALDTAKKGIKIDDQSHEYAFDLNEFFEVRNGSFAHEDSVDRFLDAMVSQDKFPFSTEELRHELKHTFWLLNRVDSAKALAKKLKEHPTFSEYEIILAAGDGRLDEDEERQKSFDKVRAAIAKYDKTITLSVGQLTTGVTIPEWTAVMMLSNVKSPALYMQAAFRAQNPCMFIEDGQYYRKENAYVFDFDPARTLIIFEEFANDLSSKTASGRGDSREREENVRQLLNFFPVIGEDEDGEMVALDAEKVLTIPRKIKSKEVVRRGFMSNYLFQNISGIFGAPQEVLDILSQFPSVDEPKKKDLAVTTETGRQLDINPETGKVEIPEETVIGIATEVFGEKIYGTYTPESIRGSVHEAFSSSSGRTEAPSRASFDAMKGKFKDSAIRDVMSAAREKYAKNLRTKDAQDMERRIDKGFERVTEQVYADHQIEERKAEHDLQEALASRAQTGRTEVEIRAEHEQRRQERAVELEEKLTETVCEFVRTSTEDVVVTMETTIREREKDSIEDDIRDHLRGFSRTIPSFLMAYGDDTVTLATFDTIVPNRVFVEVTSITLDQFRFLRDGGDYTDAETGEVKNFAGHLFDPVVFDDSVKEFLRLKKRLADYFDEKSIEDIFDYIPPQKTNQIFTPKVMVQKMVDMLEAENPGCFDDPEHTFIDLYMKSGLYITEIVKRLYRSEEMKAWFPDPKERLRHIFKNQVYGLAPTEIIYQIALSYILGFDETQDITEHNFRLLDAVPFAKDGTLAEQLDALFGEQ